MRDVREKEKQEMYIDTNTTLKMRKLEWISHVRARLRTRHPHVAAELFSRSTDQSECSILTHSITMEIYRNKQSRTSMQQCHRLDPLFIVITSV